MSARLSCALFAVAVAGCRGPEPTAPLPSTMGQTSPRTQHGMPPPAVKNLYVANESGSAPAVSVYAPGTSKPLRQITDGMVGASSLAFDAKENLYVSDDTNSAIPVYAPGAVKRMRTIVDGVHAPIQVALAPSGNVYVANDNGTVTVYKAGTTTLLQTIRKGISTQIGAIALDSSGTLYVANWPDTSSGPSWLSEYSPGQMDPARTTTVGISFPQVLAFDILGDLYVANIGGYVSVYAPTKTKPFMTISAGLTEPDGLAFDGGGNLYVSDGNNNTVTVYGPGSTKLKRTISDGVNSPANLAFGPSHWLNVANTPDNNCGSITEYAPNKSTLGRKITDRICFPAWIAFGP